MQIIALDNGLVDRRTHSYHIALSLRAIADDHGLPVRIFGSRWMKTEVKSDTGGIPFFSFGLYANFKLPTLNQFCQFALDGYWQRRKLPFDASRSEILNSKILNLLYRRDLSRLPSDVWSQDTIVIVMGACQNQLLGLINHLISAPEAKRPMVICQLMFAPSWTPWGIPSLHGKNLYAEIFKRASLLKASLKFVVETEELKAVYHQQFGINANVVPIPLADAIVSPKKRQTEQAVRLGFFGYAKKAKGFHLLPETILLAEKSSMPVRFLIHMQHTSWEEETIRTEQIMNQVPNTEILRGVLTKEKYYSLFEKVDAVLLPYDPEEYRGRGSGILVEAVSAGLPVIASANTWAATAILADEAEGEIFSPYTALGLVEAIGRLCSQIEERKSKAILKAARFRERHSTESYLRRILSLASEK